ncbi:MAG: hypothetical protein IKM26_01600 [Clostridia bacterium]|nr:hypothetical protein [Clostridia bacterium]
MKKSERIFLLLMFMLSLNIIFCSTAFAYIDPSTTTFIVQAVAGVAVAVGAVFTIWWRKAKKKVQKTLGIDENANKKQEADVIEDEDED